MNCKRLFAFFLILIPILTSNDIYASASEINLACESWGADWQETKVFFGLSKPNSDAVSRRAIDKYIVETVVPAFPNGFTLLETTGYWRNSSDDQTYYENGLQLIILHKDTTVLTEKINAIALEYRRRFDQQSVLVSTNDSAVRSCIGH